MPLYSILSPGTDGYLTGLIFSASPGILTRSVVVSPTAMAASSISVSSCFALEAEARPMIRAAHTRILPEFFKLSLFIAAAFLTPDRALLQGTENVLDLFPVHLVPSLLPALFLAFVVLIFFILIVLFVLIVHLFQHILDVFFCLCIIGIDFQGVHVGVYRLPVVLLLQVCVAGIEKGLL